MLEVHKISTYYGSIQVLFGMSLKVSDGGEIVGVLGRNGMGKTTLINSIMGLVRVRTGSVMFGGVFLTHFPVYEIARCGLGLVPEGQRIFSHLTVEENLLVAVSNCHCRSSPWVLERIYNLFPSLCVRSAVMGSLLSGGEQQMLSIGRALMTNPSLLLLDEATEGLSPLVCEEIWACLRRLKAAGISVLVVDKHAGELSRIADRFYIIEKGAVVWHGTQEMLHAVPEIQERYLGI
ncbi:MAG: ABC transporter ATP-binding protein [Alphaproteobacteria bacterium]|nr:ABC transporter ATP-binding protein [Alphaproteobacteria bacterium]